MWIKRVTTEYIEITPAQKAEPGKASAGSGDHASVVIVCGILIALGVFGISSLWRHPSSQEASEVPARITPAPGITSKPAPGITRTPVPQPESASGPPAPDTASGPPAPEPPIPVPTLTPPMNRP